MTQKIKLADGTDDSKTVTTINDPQEVDQIRVQTEARLAPGSSVSIGAVVPANPQDLVIETVKNGGSPNLLVNGSVTPVEFTYAPGAGNVLRLNSLLLVFSADDFEFSGTNFGPNATLPNGVEIIVEKSATATTVFRIHRNEDFLRLPGRAPLVNNTGPKDVLGAQIDFGGLLRLDGDTSDKVIVRINDNLSSVKFKYFTATVYGVID